MTSAPAPVQPLAGYRLLRVVLVANLLAMPVQYLAAKIGIVTGRTMPEVCGEQFSRPVLWRLWPAGVVTVLPAIVAMNVGLLASQVLR